MSSINIVCMDHYMNRPITGLDPLVSEFRATTIDKVPVLRIFGSTYEGIKACVHVHGVFPYIYVACNESTNDETDNLLATAYQLASALDKAINIILNQATATQQHIYTIAIVDGTPFYGYHRKPNKFFKLSLYNPLLIKKTATLLQSGNIMGTVFQPYEAHIPFKQQFMIDYNLFGMSFARFAHITVRDDQKLKKQSVCPLEFDVLAADILNKRELSTGSSGACNPGIQYIRDEETKRAGGDDALIKQSDLTQNRVDIEPTLSDCNYRAKLREIIRNGEGSQSDLTASCSSNLNLSTSITPADVDLDVSLLNNTQLEEHAQLLMNMWNANYEREQKDLRDARQVDDDCVLSQPQQTATLPLKRAPEVAGGVGDADEDDLNMSLFDCLSGVEFTELHQTLQNRTDEAHN